MRRCVNCGWPASKHGHPRVYFCLCTECWRPLILGALVVLLMSWLVRPASGAPRCSIEVTPRVAQAPVRYLRVTTRVLDAPVRGVRVELHGPNGLETVSEPPADRKTNILEWKNLFMTEPGEYVVFLGTSTGCTANTNVQVAR